MFDFKFEESVKVSAKERAREKNSWIQRMPSMTSSLSAGWLIGP